VRLLRSARQSWPRAGKGPTQSKIGVSPVDFVDQAMHCWLWPENNFTSLVHREPEAFGCAAFRSFGE
jgi:hypothetical protein